MFSPTPLCQRHPPIVKGLPWRKCCDSSLSRFLHSSPSSNSQWLLVDRTSSLVSLQNHTSFTSSPTDVPYQFLSGAALAGSFSIWENEKSIQEGFPGDSAPISLWFATITYICPSTPRVFFLCGRNSYLCLPTNWSGACPLVFQSPDINILPNHQTIQVPLVFPISSSSTHGRQVLHLIPLLTGLSISTTLSTRTVGISTWTALYQKISTLLYSTLEDAHTSMTSLQRQTDSIAGVVLQNWRALDLLITEKRGTCICHHKEC